MAASVGGVQSSYNERDQLMKTVVSDQGVNPNGPENLESGSFQVTTTYDYYADGGRHVVRIGPAANNDHVTYQYDTRGRVVHVADANGSSTQELPGQSSSGSSPWAHGDGEAVTTTSYTPVSGATPASKTELVTWTSGPGGASCSHEVVTSYSLKSFLLSQSTSNTCDVNGAKTSAATYHYTADGLIDSTAYDAAGPRMRLDGLGYLTETTSMAQAQPNTYDGFGNLTYGKQISNFHFPTYGEYPETDVHNTRWETSTYTPETGYLRNKLTTNSDAAYAAQNSDVTYGLDAWGNRLSVQAATFPDYAVDDTTGQLTHPELKRSDPSAYDGYIKRYDADGRVSMFFRFESTALSAYSDFLYDPMGNQVLTANSGIEQFSSDVSLTREYNSVYTSANGTQIIRKHWGEHTANTWGDPDQAATWDGSFSLADGIRADTSWSAVVLFDASRGRAPLPLTAPTSSLSVRLGVAPADITAPVNAVPSVGDEVLPPAAAVVAGTASTAEESADAGEGIVGLPSAALPALDGLLDVAGVNQPADTAGIPASQSPVTPMELPLLSALPLPGEAGGSRDGASEAPASPPGGVSGGAVSDLTLALPTRAVPNSTLRPDDVEAPQAAHVLPPDATPNPGQVTPPGRAAPPVIGPNPSDGAGDILPPADLQPPRVPSIGGGQPGDIGHITPPIGWAPPNGDEAVEPFRILGACPDGNFETGCSTSTPASDVDGQARNDERSIEQATGSDADAGKRDLDQLRLELDAPGLRPDQRAGRGLHYRVAKASGINSPVAHAVEVINNVTADEQVMSRAQRFNMYARLAYLVQQGGKNLDEIVLIGILLERRRGRQSRRELGDALRSDVQNLTPLMNRGDFRRVYSRMEEFPDPREVELGESWKEHAEEWLDMGVVVGAHVGGTVEFVERSLAYDAGLSGSNKAWDERAGKLVKGGGYAFEVVMAAFDLNATLHDTDLANVPTWERGALSLGKSTASFGAGVGGALVGTWCGPAAIACSPILGATFSSAASVYYEQRLIEPLRSYPPLY